jgi:hypothetical protein
LQHQQGRGFRQRLLFSTQLALQSIVAGLQLAQGQLGVTGFRRRDRAKRVTPGDQLMLEEPPLAAPGVQRRTRQAVGLLQGEQALSGALGLRCKSAWQFGRGSRLHRAAIRASPPLSQRADRHVQFLGNVANATRAALSDLAQRLVSEFVGVLVSAHGLLCFRANRGSDN